MALPLAEGEAPCGMVDHGGVDGYFAPAGPGPDARAASVQPPNAHGGRRVVLPALCVALLLSVIAAVVAVRAAGAAVVPALRSVATPASAEAGWGPSYIDTLGRPARWDPCMPIHYVVHTRWAPPTGRADLATALAQLSEASGLRFVDDGETGEVPLRTREAYQPARYGKRWAPILIGWVPVANTDLGLGDGVQGVTMAIALGGRDGGSIVTAQVALDADRRLPGGFGAGATEGEVLLHELAHAVGLGHVQDPTQVMFPQTTNSESQFGAGDRAGLAALGRNAGCLPAPKPRALEAPLTDTRS